MPVGSNFCWIVLVNTPIKKSIISGFIVLIYSVVYSTVNKKKEELLNSSYYSLKILMNEADFLFIFQ
jgi:hypothetical protein